MKAQTERKGIALLFL